MRGGLGSARRNAPVAACLALVVLAGCGNSSHYKNDPRPPATLVITASILPDKVSVSPSHFGAGPVSLVVANETDTSQQITIARQVNGVIQNLPDQTGPINPHDTASLKADIDQGDYLVRVEASGIKPAKVSVGPKRASAQNELLQP
jgi:hypothetical protein